MRARKKLFGFFLNFALGGLAVALLIVVLKPDLVALPRPMPGAPQSYADAVSASSPSVVSIYTELSLNESRRFSAVPVRGGLGSGVLINADGYLVTNWHVVDGAEQIRVQLADGRVAIPKLVGTDPDTELALLRIDLTDLPSIKLGRSDTLKVGDVVLAIGNSFGFSQTVTIGIVSATGRGQLGVTTFENFIQTDAAINIGNSGGALVNARGELVGINTAVLGSLRPQRATPAGIGFAIPVNLVRGVMDQLITHGRVIRGFLGVEPSDLTARETAMLGIDGPAVLLNNVWGPAAEAGLSPGDVLTHINGQRVTNSQRAMNMVASSQPGDHMTVRVVRDDGFVFEAEAVLEERAPR